MTPSLEEALKWAVIPYSHNPKDCLAQGETMTYTCDCDDKAREVLAAALREAQAEVTKLKKDLDETGPLTVRDSYFKAMARAEKAETELAKANNDIEVAYKANDGWREKLNKAEQERDALRAELDELRKAIKDIKI